MKFEKKLISVFDTTITDNNLGNAIIMDSVNKNLETLFPNNFFLKLPYLDSIGKESIKYIQNSKYVFLGGTNALSADIDTYSQWGINEDNCYDINNVILMGVGWWQYQEGVTEKTRNILKSVLHPGYLHSVRDSYTEKKLREAGFDNVINTGCPTLWGLTEGVCKNIPVAKSKNALITFTNYNQDLNYDALLCNTVKNNYSDVYVWVQGPEDFEYARDLDSYLKILPPNLKSLDNLLASGISLDYIGTRLHAGIRAMQHGRRSVIIAIDNRTIEMGNDFNLPYILRKDLDDLDAVINSDFKTALKLNQEFISKWKEQFDVDEKGFHNLMQSKSTLTPKVISKNHAPVSRVFGLDRGTPIDRVFIEQFLRDNRQCITGNTLEIASNDYTLKYGVNVTKSDILHATDDNPGATIIGDLSTGLNIPHNCFDCIILTQTIHVIYDFKSALNHAFNALKNGGVLLVTAPGISQISKFDMDRWGDYWRFTDKCLENIFTEISKGGVCNITTYGNCQLAMEFLNGRAAEELSEQLFSEHDKDYQLLIGAKIVKNPDILCSPSGQISVINPLKSEFDPMILIYHRVNYDSVDSQLLAVNPDNFRDHMRFLAENFRVISLGQLVSEKAAGKLLSNTVTVTFDDGYLDNLTFALPILEEYKIPATIFITSKMLDKESEFWWDELERIFITSPELPESLSFNFSNFAKSWKTSTPEERLLVHEETAEIIKNCRPDDIEKIMMDLKSWAGSSDPPRSGKRILKTEQLRELAQSSYIEIGAHTNTHAKMSILTPEEQEHEIKLSKSILEKSIGKRIKFFSYPFGSGTDFNNTSMDLVKTLGFEAGIANNYGYISVGSNQYALPRILVRNWSGKQFGDWIKTHDKQNLERETLANRAPHLLKTIQLYTPFAKSNLDIYKNAKSLINIGEIQLAINELEMIFNDQNEIFIPALLELGDLYFRTGFPNKALNCFKKVLRFEPGNPKALRRVYLQI